jgi:hypothetical protein
MTPEDITDLERLRAAELERLRRAEADRRQAEADAFRLRQAIEKQARLDTERRREEEEEAEEATSGPSSAIIRPVVRGLVDFMK